MINPEVGDIIEERWSDDLYRIAKWKNNDEIIINSLHSCHSRQLDIDILHEHFKFAPPALTKLWKLLNE